MKERQKVLAEINAERDRQEAKWGRQDHTPEVWLSILGEEFGEVCKAVCEASFPGYETTGDWSQYRKELIHVAAVAAAMAECFDRREEAPVTKKRKAPYLDFSGKPIYEGDTIMHPDLTTGKVYYNERVTPDSYRWWRVWYTDGNDLCLGLQVGDKGMAIVVDPIDAHNKKAVAEARAFNKRYEEGL